MILEKDKIYKVKHGFVYGFPKNFIIFSPLDDIVLQDDFFKGREVGYCVSSRCRHINTHFTVRFDSKIETKFDLDRYGNPHHSSTGVDPSCELIEKFTNEDYNYIKQAMSILGGDYHYNRKLNKIVYGI